VCGIETTLRAGGRPICHTCCDELEERQENAYSGTLKLSAEPAQSTEGPVATKGDS
jgi:hypothetical protein